MAALACPTPAEARLQHEVGRTRTVVASWYRHGHTTANGERFDPNGLTMAHRTLPFGTHVKLVNPSNGQDVVVRVNDRGPFVQGRDCDVSLGTAIALDMRDKGVTRLRATVLSLPA